MMRRESAFIHLDAAVDRSDVTILRGLPRVGRSSFLKDWRLRRTDAMRCRTVGEIRLEPGIFILDHVDVRMIDPIVNIVRAAEEAKARTRLVVAPIDLVTAERLRTNLPGVVGSVELAPLRVEDLSADVGQQAAAGPVEAASLSAIPASAPAADTNRHWLRGGFPDSLLATNDQDSIAWRIGLLDGLLARDYTDWGLDRSFPMDNMFRWIANRNSAELDENGCGFAKRQQLKSAVYVMERLGLVRRLPNYPAGSSVSMDRKQKLFVRDTGLLHASLGIQTMTQLRANHSAIGGSFESYATEALILAAEGRATAQFYREVGHSGEDEIDLILNFPSQNGRLIAIEFKVGPDQRPNRGFHDGCAALDIRERFVVHSGNEVYCDGQVDRLDLKSAVARISMMSEAE